MKKIVLILSLAGKARTFITAGQIAGSLAQRLHLSCTQNLHGVLTPALLQYCVAEHEDITVAGIACVACDIADNADIADVAGDCNG